MSDETRPADGEPVPSPLTAAGVVGSWEVDGETMKFDADGSFGAWIAERSAASGTWRLEDTTIVVSDEDTELDRFSDVVYFGDTMTAVRGGARITFRRL